MKRTLLVVVLVLALTFAFAASAFATTGKFFAGGTDYYRWAPRTGSPAPGTAFVKNYVNATGDNAANPGVHANYLATTAKCGICHSVHRAAGDGTKLLPISDATCAGCHTGGTTITNKVITWAPVDLDWVPSYDASGNVTNEPAAGGGGGPHNDPVWDTALDVENQATEYPLPSYELEPFSRYGCFTRRCHATNPHGANSSKYTLFAAKLLFNNTPAEDSAEYPELVAEGRVGTYGGDDAVYDNLGATDAAVQRFADANPTIVTLSGSNILINGAAPDAADTHALVAGLTCGRPSNPGTGEDECHAEASYAIVDKGIKENRNHGTGITGNDGSIAGIPNKTQDPVNGNNNAFRTDNTGVEAAGWGGNDNRDSKTGHVAGSFAAVPDSGSYAAINGCTSCHDQTDAANTVAGNFTFPHGQTATGATNLYTPAGASATGLRVRIWAGYSGSTVDTRTTFSDNYSNQKAFDGQCLKCHRDGTGEGIGLTK